MLLRKKYKNPEESSNFIQSIIYVSIGHYRLYSTAGQSPDHQGLDSCTENLQYSHARQGILTLQTVAGHQSGLGGTLVSVFMVSMLSV